MGQQNNQNPQNQSNKTRIAITPVTMIAASKTKMVSTNDLEKMLSDIFRHTTPDYYGSRVQVDMNGRINADVFFIDSSVTPTESQFKAVNVVGKGTNKNLGAVANSIRNWNRRNQNSSRYELTDDAKEAFERFIPHDPRFTNGFNRQTNKLNINWKAAVREDYEQSSFGQANTVLVRIPIDLTYVLSRVYGTKTEEGQLSYDLKVFRPLNPMRDPQGNTLASKWLFWIIQINNREVQEAYSLAGGLPMTNSLGINRA